MFRRSALALVVAVVAGLVVQVGRSVPAHATQPGANGKIAFSSDFDGRVEVYTANPDGTGVTELTDNPDARGPSWSPDGTSLAFAGGPDPSGIYTMTASGTGVHRVTDGGYMTAWSPDGSHIAFARNGTSG